MTQILLQSAYLSAVGFCLYTSGWLMVKARKNQTVWAFTVCQCLVIFWCVPRIFSIFSTTREIKYVLYGISYVGISFIGPAWLLFSFFYSETPPPGRRHKFRDAKCARFRLIGLLFGLSAFDFFMFLTNEFHHLFYRVFEVEQTVYGPVFYFHMAYTYCCVLLGMGAVLWEFRKKQAAFVHVLLIILAAAVPLGFNLLYISRLVHTGFDLTPPAFALSSFLMFLAVFQYDFLDVNVLAFDRILESVAEGVLVYNKRGVVTYCNQAAEKWLGLEPGKDFSVFRARFGFPAAEDKEEEKNFASRLITLSGGVKLRARQYICRDKKGAASAGILLLADVGEYYQLLQQSRELAVSEQRLAVEQERNRIAREVHDTTGHTLAMISSLLKLIRIACEKEKGQEISGREEKGREISGREEKGREISSEEEKEQTIREKEGMDKESAPGPGADCLAEEESIWEYLDQAQALASDGIRQLRLSINHMRQETDCGLVTQGVRQLAESVKGLKIEIEIQGRDGPEYSGLRPVVYNCLREAVTNCLKYAGASRMDVIVKFAAQNVSLYIFDDGKGCASIQESQGIRGIRERVAEAGGQVRFLSAAGEGFQIYVELPVHGIKEEWRGS